MNHPNTYDSNNPKQKYTPIEQMLGQMPTLTENKLPGRVNNTHVKVLKERLESIAWKHVFNC